MTPEQERALIQRMDAIHAMVSICCGFVVALIVTGTIAMIVHLAK